MVIKVHKVLIDPGHGGGDPGNVQAGVPEKASTLSLAAKALHYVQLFSWNPILGGPQVKGLLSRSDDRYVGIDNRAKMARANGCDLMLSVHTNSSVNILAAGAEAFVSAKDTPYSAASRQLAINMLDRLIDCGFALRSVKSDDKSNAGSLGVLRETIGAMPAVLIEPGFASNWHDRRILCSPTGKEQTAMAIAQAVIGHYGLDWRAGQAAYANR